MRGMGGMRGMGASPAAMRARGRGMGAPRGRGAMGPSGPKHARMEQPLYSDFDTMGYEEDYSSGYEGYGAGGYGAEGYGAEGYGAESYGAAGLSWRAAAGAAGAEDYGYGMETYGAEYGYGAEDTSYGYGSEDATVSSLPSNLQKRYAKLAQDISESGGPVGYADAANAAAAWGAW